MTVVAIARLKNEADVAEQFVRHTLAHVDRLIVQDNSEDGTPEILHALVREGLPLTVLPESTVGDFQARNTTQLMNWAAESADWVLPLDADEFIKSERPLRDVLASVATGLGVYQLPWQTYVYDREGGGNQVLRMTRRLQAEATQYSKVLAAKEVALEGKLCKGAHLVYGHENSPTLPDVYLAHYPIRSCAQWALKAVIHNLQERCVSGSAAVPMNAAPAVKELIEFGYLSPNTAGKFSRRYAATTDAFVPQEIEDPLQYLGGPLLYPTEPERMLSTLLKFANRMADELYEARK